MNFIARIGDKLTKRLFVILSLSIICGCGTLGGEATRNNITAACDRLNEIRRVPFRVSDYCSDEAYNEIMAQGEDAVPCLIEKITDMHRMEDPRMSFGGETNFRVGDMAVFMIMDITGMDLVDFMPPEEHKDVETSGIYAYFAYVYHEENRSVIKENVTRWCRENGKSL